MRKLPYSEVESILTNILPIAQDAQATASPAGSIYSVIMLGSSTSATLVPYIVEARMRLRSLFANDHDLKALYQAIWADPECSARDFQKTLRRLLRVTAKSLAEESLKNVLYERAARLLSTSAAEIALHVTEQNPAWLSQSLLSKGDATHDALSLLDRFLETDLQGEASDPQDEHVREGQIGEDDADFDKDMDVEANETSAQELLEMEDVAAFLRRSDSFATLRAKLQDYAHNHTKRRNEELQATWSREMGTSMPFSLRLTEPANLITMSPQQPGLADSLKLLIETHSGLEWNWWPLARPIQASLLDRVNLQWNCVCDSI